MGVKIPTTWAELMDVSEKIKRAGYRAFSMPNSGSPNSGSPNSGSNGWQMAELTLILESQLWAKEEARPEWRVREEGGDARMASRQRTYVPIKRDRPDGMIRPG